MLYSFEKKNNFRCLSDIESANSQAGALIGGPLALIIANSTNYADLVRTKFIDTTELYCVSVIDNNNEIKAVLAGQADRTYYLVIYNNNNLVCTVYITEINVLIVLKEVFTGRVGFSSTRRDIAPYVKLDRIIGINTRLDVDLDTETIKSIVNQRLMLSCCSKKYLVINNMVLTCIGIGRAHKDLQIKSKSYLGQKIDELVELFDKAPTGLLDLDTFVANIRNNAAAQKYLIENGDKLRPAHIALITPLSDIENTADIIVGLISTPEEDALCARLSSAWFKRAVKQKLTRFPIETTTNGKYDVQKLQTQATIKYNGQTWKGARKTDDIYVITHHDKPNSIIGVIGVDPKDIARIMHHSKIIKNDIEHKSTYTNVNINITTKHDIRIRDIIRAHRHAGHVDYGFSFTAYLMYALLNELAGKLNCTEETLKTKYNLDIRKYKVGRHVGDTTEEDCSNIVMTTEELFLFLSYVEFDIDVKRHADDLIKKYCNINNVDLLIQYAQRAKDFRNSFKFSFLSKFNSSDKFADVRIISRNHVETQMSNLTLKDLDDFYKTVENRNLQQVSFMIASEFLVMTLEYESVLIVRHDFNVPKVNFTLNGHKFTGIRTGNVFALHDVNMTYALNILTLFDTDSDDGFYELSKFNDSTIMLKTSDFVFPIDTFYGSMRNVRNDHSIVPVRKAIYGKTFEDFMLGSQHNSEIASTLFTGNKDYCPDSNMVSLINHFGRYFATYDEYKAIITQEAAFDNSLNSALTKVETQRNISPANIDIDDIELDDEYEDELFEEEQDADTDTDTEIEYDDIDDISLNEADEEDSEADGDEAAWNFNRQSWLLSHPNESYIETNGNQVYWFDVLHNSMYAEHLETGEALPYNDIITLQSVWQNILKSMPGVKDEELIRMMYDDALDNASDDADLDDNTAPETQEPEIEIDDDDDLFSDL